MKAGLCSRGISKKALKWFFACGPIPLQRGKQIKPSPVKNRICSKEPFNKNSFYKEKKSWYNWYQTQVCSSHCTTGQSIQRRVVGARTLIGKLADREDGRLVSQKNIFLSPSSAPFKRKGSGGASSHSLTVTCLGEGPTAVLTGGWEGPLKVAL